MSTIIKLTAGQAAAMADLAEKEAAHLAAQLRKPGPFVVVVLR